MSAAARASICIGSVRRAPDDASIAAPAMRAFASQQAPAAPLMSTYATTTGSTTSSFLRLDHSNPRATVLTRPMTRTTFKPETTTMWMSPASCRESVRRQAGLVDAKGNAQGSAPPPAQNCPADGGNLRLSPCDRAAGDGTPGGEHEDLGGRRDSLNILAFECLGRVRARTPSNGRRPDASISTLSPGDSAGIKGPLTSTPP